MALTVTPTDEMKTLTVGNKIYEVVDDEARTDLTNVKADLSAEETRAKSEEARIEALFTAPAQEAVNNWLNNHPEATTTVQDGTITKEKLSKDLQFKSLIQLDSMSYSDVIQLPVEKSYLEGITYLNGQYYAVCRDYTSTPNKTYVVIYTSAFSLVNYVYTDASYGIANNITNDGTKIYVDYDNGYHVSFDKNISNDYAVQNTAFRNIAFWNKTRYGIAINANAVTVSTLSSDFIVIDTVCMVSTVRQDLQSAQIIDGILYISTTKGLFKFIDVLSGTMLAEVPYYSSKEIECFFEDADGSIKCCGHFYGTDGIFNIGSFVDGIDYPEMSYAPIDATYGNYNIWTGERYGFYKITNGLVAGLPADTGDLLIFENLRLMCSLDDDAIFAYDKDARTWQRIGSLKKSSANVSITIGSKTITNAMRVERNGATVSASMMFRKADGTTVISNGTVIGNIPEGFRPTMDRWCCAIVRDDVPWAGANYYPIAILIEANGDVSLYGNVTYLTSAMVVWFSDSYIIA